MEDFTKTKMISLLLMMLIWMIDLITTFIGLRLGAYETNTLFAPLFEIEYSGYFIAMILVVFIFLVCLSFVDLVFFVDKHYKKELKHKDYFLINMILVVLIYLVELNAIINNLFVILQLI